MAAQFLPVRSDQISAAVTPDSLSSCANSLMSGNAKQRENSEATESFRRKSDVEIYQKHLLCSFMQDPEGKAAQSTTLQGLVSPRKHS
jgi:hypothetical protein